MIIEIKYKALHWNNHQGGGGEPFNGSLLRNVDASLSLDKVMAFAFGQLCELQDEKRNIIGDYVFMGISTNKD